MSFCAICTADIPADSPRAPLGKDGVLVLVCRDCVELHPRSGRYSFEGGRSHENPEARASSGAGFGSRDGGSLGNGNVRRGYRGNR